MSLFIRRLHIDDAEPISAAFAGIGWQKPVENYVKYIERQKAGELIVLVAEWDEVFAGHVQICWKPDYAPCPEIQDLNVLPQYRRRGIATALMDQAEALIAERSDRVAIGVGLHPGYNAAQRMYVLRGYVPDGKGVTWRGEYIKERQELIADDDLVLHLSKALGTGR